MDQFIPHQRCRAQTHKTNQVLIACNQQILYGRINLHLPPRKMQKCTNITSHHRREKQQLFSNTELLDSWWNANFYVILFEYCYGNALLFLHLIDNIM